jgi:hypothetical protein
VLRLPPGYSTFKRRSNAGLGGVSPRRAIEQGEAVEAMQSQAIVMHKLAIRKMGCLPVVGDIVQLKIPDVDRGKRDNPCLTVIVIEVRQCCWFRVCDVDMLIMRLFYMHGG